MSRNTVLNHNKSITREPFPEIQIVVLYQLRNQETGYAVEKRSNALCDAQGYDPWGFYISTISCSKSVLKKDRVQHILTPRIPLLSHTN